VLSRLPDNDRDVLVIVHPDVMQILRTHDGILDELQRKHLARLTFRTDPNYTREQFIIANAKTGDDLKG
ncbi:MAG: ribonuclease E/G, partial [Roseimicrobium sp.]